MTDTNHTKRSLLSAALLLAMACGLTACGPKAEFEAINEVVQVRFVSFRGTGANRQPTFEVVNMTRRTLRSFGGTVRFFGQDNTRIAETWHYQQLKPDGIAGHQSRQITLAVTVPSDAASASFFTRQVTLDP